MALKIALSALIVALLASVGAARADVYRPGEFLGLTLERAALSPKLLGPATQFEPVPVEARADAKMEPAKVSPVRTVRAARRPQAGAARTKLAHRRGNPLDAQASDTRVQIWPCRSGGICNWQH
jgi:hypothetical protein